MMAAVIEQGSAKFSVHFDGPITTNHHLSVRAMARTYEHVQRAIDRAYLVEKYGVVWKHARLKAEDYEHVDFIAAYPQEGGIILDAVRRGTEISGQIIDRIASAMTAPFERAMRGGLDENAALRDQLGQRRRYVHDIGRQQVPSLQTLIENPPREWARAYSNRSILKEIDQLTTQIVPDELDGSSVEISLYGNHARSTYAFTPDIAARFHGIVAARELGPVVLVNARIRDLDRGNKFSKPKAKILNIDSGREASLHLASEADFHALHPYHTADSVPIFASPFLEAGGFDVNGGDLVFVAVAA
jgi:hypothetical protein